MTETHTAPVEDLEELLAEEIPCGGIRYRPVARSCTRSAVVFTEGHGCNPSSPARFKCVQCWQVWYKANTASLACKGYLRCKNCDRVFNSVEDFADYRPF